MLTNKELYEAAMPSGQYGFRTSLFLWPNRSLFLGPLQQLTILAMGSVAINIGLYQPFFMKTPNGTYQPYRSAIIPARDPTLQPALAYLTETMPDQIA